MKSAVLVSRTNITFQEESRSTTSVEDPRFVLCNCSKDSFVAVRLARGVGRDRCPSRIKVKATLRDFLERGKHARGRQIKDVSAFYEILMSKRVCWASRGSCSATAAAPGSAKRDPARWPPFYKTRRARRPSKVGKNLHPRDNHAGKSLKSHPSRTEVSGTSKAQMAAGIFNLRFYEHFDKTIYLAACCAQTFCWFCWWKVLLYLVRHFRLFVRLRYLSVFEKGTLENILVFYCSYCIAKTCENNILWTLRTFYGLHTIKSFIFKIESAFRLVNTLCKTLCALPGPVHFWTLQ